MVTVDDIADLVLERVEAKLNGKAETNGSAEVVHPETEPIDLLEAAQSPADAEARLTGFLVENPGMFIVARGSKLVFSYAGEHDDRELEQIKRDKARRQSTSW